MVTKKINHYAKREKERTQPKERSYSGATNKARDQYKTTTNNEPANQNKETDKHNIKERTTEQETKETNKSEIKKEEPKRRIGGIRTTEKVK